MATKFGDQGRGISIGIPFDGSRADAPAPVSSEPTNGDIPAKGYVPSITFEDLQDDIGLPTIDPVDAARQVHQMELDSIMKQVNFVQEKMDRVKHGVVPGTTEYVFEGEQRYKLQIQLDQLKETYGGQVEIGNRKIVEAQRAQADKLAGMQADADREVALAKRAEEINFEREAKARAENVSPLSRRPLGSR